MDGECMIGDMVGNLDYECFNLYVIDCVEIVKGVSSIFYGLCVVGVVINLIIKKIDKFFLIDVGICYG